MTKVREIADKHIALVQVTKDIWIAACEAQGTDPKASFVAQAADNTLWAVHTEAMMALGDFEMATFKTYIHGVARNAKPKFKVGDMVILPGSGNIGTVIGYEDDGTVTTSSFQGVQSFPESEYEAYVDPEE